MTAAWSSADSSIATVSSDGTVKTVSRGETTTNDTRNRRPKP